MEEDGEDGLITTAVAAEILGIQRRMVQRKCRNGVLPFKKLKGSSEQLLLREDVEAYKAIRRGPGRPPLKRTADEVTQAPQPRRKPAKMLNETATGGGPKSGPRKSAKGTHKVRAKKAPTRK